MKYPITCITNGSKISWLLKAQESLRQEHNIMGEWFDELRDPITLEKYQTLRAEVQIAFPYVNENLSKEDWDKYQTDRFNIKQSLIDVEMGRLKNACFESSTYSPNLDDDLN